MANRNTPAPITPHNLSEQKVEGLRDISPTPSTYRKFQRMPDGTEIFVGVFPTPLDVPTQKRVIRRYNK